MISQLTENEISCQNINPSIHTGNFSQPDYFYLLENLVNENPDSTLSRQDNFKIKVPDFIKKTINDLSFELKTCLSNIMLASDLFEPDLPSGEQEMFIDIIQRNTKRISGVIAILEFPLTVG